MAKKAKTPASKFEALVELKYGRGKKAQTVTIPITVDFETIWVPEWQSLSQSLKDQALELALDVEVTDRVLNSKELLAAYKAWDKGFDDDTAEE